VPRRAKEAIGGIALLKNESTGHQVFFCFERFLWFPASLMTC